MIAPTGGSGKVAVTNCGIQGVECERRALASSDEHPEVLPMRGTHVREARLRFQVERQRGLALAEAFFHASRSGDMKAIAAMPTNDVGLQADGGGKRPAVEVPVLGFDAVMRFMDVVTGIPKNAGSKLDRVAIISGLPGFITREADGELQTTALGIEDGKIAAIYVMRNPDKLKHLH
jgi:RNA polymerase sigma-70 factor (ECF subfamily)